MSNERAALHKTFRAMGIRLLITSSLLLAAFVMGCAGGTATPPELVADRSSCHKCQMLISDTRYAAAINDGEIRTFDDIGCMLSAITSMKQEPANVWVRDFNKNTWLDARKASYVFAAKLGTPMNYGFVAVVSRTEAQSLATRVAGQPIDSWGQLRQQFKERR
ncbi:MAG: nitrous oxide reductase accessory protein NosL [Bacteroidota bacterium]|nr:nitrous oxide reductase accessory protein NosL [Bacteroidota bacterium]MDP4232435.1 nitrous oxide reductase accessory protein NosL [Bacteroidota bacterium]MDP4241571.1 nitrous oxide reductase accessory protein NosL [Bacteroidota bacterium]MDP4286315.1 nitrous oxide reductase accessory protein NosL [Bacteroidota bacterium]